MKSKLASLEREQKTTAKTQPFPPSEKKKFPDLAERGSPNDIV